ncbi:unnamed protein product [Durusdinium trenchii]|uniref:Pentatricopeptide repeat-containing protein, chloroplastic n=1 Tax=Durusdinium trenchii TaxID=1381693 RepID=A0ABP0N7A1_9DINO
MALAFLSIPRHELGPPTPSSSSGNRRGTFREARAWPHEAAWAAAAAQIWACRGLRDKGRARRRTLQWAGTALSLERGIAGKLKRERLKVDEDLFDQLNELAAKGHVSSAREIFEQLMAYAEQDEEGRKRRGPTKEVPTTMVYNTMLKASANAGDVEGANEMAALMRAEGLFMNEKFYGKMMEAAAKAGDIAMATKWFEESQAAKMPPNYVHFFCVVDAHVKAGELEQARQWLARTRAAGIPLQTNMFNLLILAFASRGQTQEATGLLREMLQEGLDPDVSSFAALAVAAAQDGDDAGAERMMMKAKEQKLEWNAQATQVAFARLAAVSDSAERAEGWLRKMQDSGLTPGLENFTVIVDAYAKEGQVDKVVALMEEMVAADVQPSVVTYSSAMYACIKAGRLDQAEVMLSQMMDLGLNPDGVAYGTIMTAYAKAGEPQGAINIAEQMKASGIPVTVREHNSILEALVKAGKPNDAARYLMQMPKMVDHASRYKWKRGSSDPDVYSYAIVMGALASAGRTSSVDSLHQAMQIAGVEATPVLHDAIMRGYLSAKRPREASRWLQEADQSGLVLNAKIICCAMEVCLHNRQADEALRWLQRGEEAGVEVPTAGVGGVLFHVTAVEACAKAGDVDRGLDWLQRAETAGLNSEQKLLKEETRSVPLRPAYLNLMKAFLGRQMDVVFGVLKSLEDVEGQMDLMARVELLQLLASRGRREDALKMLERVKKERAEKELLLVYSRAISACTKAANVDEAIFWFDEMRRSGVQPDKVAWNSIINACARNGRPAEAEMWLGEMEASEMQPDVVSYNTVINVCAHNDRPEEVSRQLPCTLVSYNSAITACARASQWHRAILLLQSFQSETSADIISYNAAIHSCEEPGMWEVALDLWEQLGDMSLQKNAVTFGSMISTCAKASQWELALDVLERQSSRGASSLISCNAALTALERSQQWSLALQLLVDFPLTPDIISFNSAISACGKAGQTMFFRRLLFRLRRLSLQENLVTYNAIINGFAVSSRWQEALDALQTTSRALETDLVSFHSASAACVASSAWQRALRLMEMAKDVRLRLDRVSYTLAINAYEKANQWQEAVHLLRSFQKAADIMFYNAAINACADQWQQGVLVLSQLNEDQIRANAVTYGALLSACRNGRAWIPALRLLSELFQLKLETNSVVFNATINACGRAEQWTHALEVMSIMEQEQIQPDLITYDTIIAATASCACREEALLLLSQSQSLRTPLEALWVLATVGSNDVEVICASFRETLTLDLEVANVVQLLWCMARLGINQQRLERSLCQRFLENLQSCSLEQLLLVAVAVERRPDITTFDRLQQAAEERSEALQPKDMAFQLKGISLLGFVSSCQRAGLLRQHLKVSIHRSLLDFGRTMDSIDAEGPSLPVQDVEVLEKTKNLPCFAGDYGDRVVLFKPGGWEVYGAHHPRQLSEFLRSYGDRPILADENHNLGFLHRLDVPSSGLIMFAKTYEAFYDLQVQLHVGEFLRDYMVLAHGLLPISSRQIQAHLLSSKGPSIPGGRGKWSCTNLECLGHAQQKARTFSELLLRIVTGRKHQIRSVLSYVGHPSVRDGLYTNEETFLEDGQELGCSQNWLHRHRLIFLDRVGGRHDLQSPLPWELQQSLQRLQFLWRKAGCGGGITVEFI